MQKLQRQVDEQDALIRELQRKLDALIKQVESATEPEDTTAAAKAPEGSARPQAETRAAQAPAAPKPSAPGQVTATEEDAERALERTLTATGVLLLPYGQLQLAPSFTYTRRESTSPLNIATTQGVVAIEQRDPRRNEFESSISAFAGLPFDSQLELSLPYNVVQQEGTNASGRSQSDTGQGLGDFSIGIAKTVLREKGWRPDLIARVTWNTGTGTSKDNGVDLNSGFDELTGQLVALKRQDPFAFFAGASYQKTFENNHIEPGDSFTFSGGAFLAASPETSLQLSLDQTFTQDLRSRGRVVEGSDQVQSVLNLGVSSILARNVLLQVVAGVGLTDESPDYSFTVSLPISFNVPAPRLNQ